MTYPTLPVAYPMPRAAEPRRTIRRGSARLPSDLQQEDPEVCGPAAPDPPALPGGWPCDIAGRRGHLRGARKSDLSEIARRTPYRTEAHGERGPSHRRPALVRMAREAPDGPPTTTSGTAKQRPKGRMPFLTGFGAAPRRRAFRGDVGWGAAYSSGSESARASEQIASWCFRVEIPMKLRASSSIMRCCGVARNALSL